MKLLEIALRVLATFLQKLFDRIEAVRGSSWRQICIFVIGSVFTFNLCLDVPQDDIVEQNLHKFLAFNESSVLFLILYFFSFLLHHQLDLQITIQNMLEQLS